MVRVFSTSSRARGALFCALAAVPLTQCYSTSGNDGGGDDASAGSPGFAGEGTGARGDAGSEGSGGSSGANGASAGEAGSTAVGGGGSSAGEPSPGSSGEGPVAGNTSGGEGGAEVAPPDCGDGVVDAAETCDDGDRSAEDGCSPTCTIEDGWACAGSPSLCALTTCGNGSLEVGEACDDGNVAALDGCSPTCSVEPSCDAAGCESACGDGILAGEEACDDGNVKSGDGCSAACAVEDGFTCSAASCDRLGGSCVLRLPAMFRDFNAHDVAGGHPDFGPAPIGTGAVQGLVEAELDAEGKPVLSPAATVVNGFMHGSETFAQWYRTSAVNAAIPGEIVLWDGGGYYVNRWGASGERWTSLLSVTDILYGGPAGGGCTSCTPEPGQVCQDPCRAEFWETYSCCGPAELPSFDGNPLFFPIDGAANALDEPRGEGRVPETYGFAGWPWESAVATSLDIVTPIPTATAPFPSLTHNFNFTTEVRFWFRYDAGKNYTLNFQGDDDLWVFLNGRLAIDLGGWHVPLDGLLAIDAVGDVYTRTTLAEGENPVELQISGSDFGIVDGGLNSISVFHAERQPEGSSFLLGLQGFDAQRSVCVR